VNPNATKPRARNCHVVTGAIATIGALAPGNDECIGRNRERIDAPQGVPR